LQNGSLRWKAQRYARFGPQQPQIPRWATYTSASPAATDAAATFADSNYFQWAAVNGIQAHNLELVRENNCVVLAHQGCMWRACNKDCYSDCYSNVFLSSTSSIGQVAAVIWASSAVASTLGLLPYSWHPALLHHVQHGAGASVRTTVAMAVCVQATFQGGLRGVKAVQSIAAGAALVTVPRNMALMVTPQMQCPFPEFVDVQYWQACPW
jgi:hypothetical protein